MKFKYCLLGFALLTALTGCNRSSDTAAKPDPVEATKDYTVQKKDEFMAAMGQKLKDLDAKIDGLAKKSAGYKDDARAQADRAMAALRGQRDTLGKKIDALKQTGQDTWAKAQAGVASAWSEVEKAYEDTKSRFN